VRVQVCDEWVMTIFEIADQLPNGFHDAEIETIYIDYPNRVVEIRLNVWIGTMDDPESTRETYRKATLTLTGVWYCAMDSPDEGYPYAAAEGLTVDLAEPTLFVPKQATFACRFWVDQWNAFIHLAAASADLAWEGAAANRGA
jgi:hypothetical protein